MLESHLAPATFSPWFWVWALLSLTSFWTRPGRQWASLGAGASLLVSPWADTGAVCAAAGWGPGACWGQSGGAGESTGPESWLIDAGDNTGPESWLIDTGEPGHVRLIQRALAAKLLNWYDCFAPMQNCLGQTFIFLYTFQPYYCVC